MASKSPRRAAASKSSQTDAISLLKADHQRVRALCRQFEKLGDDQDRIQLIEQACMELRVHTQVEEELFYPTARGLIEAEELLDEAAVEHEVAKQLIEKLETGDLDDDQRNATFKVLGEYVNHHIEEEETELFKQLRKADIDLQSLGGEMQARKEQLQQDLGIAVEAPPPKTQERGTGRGASRAH